MELISMFNRPLALRQAEADMMIAAFQGRISPAALGFQEDGGGERLGLFDGIAVIPVKGILTNSDSGGWWGTGYQWIRAAFAAAQDDPEVRAIAFDINSGGGDVAGCFDLTDTIYQVRGRKPMWSILSESAYSGAYAIASATDRIIVPRTGGTGSIGVLSMHLDLSDALAAGGMKVSVFRYGSRKAETNPYEHLTEEAIAAIQADVDAMGDLFVSTVARNRNLDADVIRGTQAATFLGHEGASLGLADAVMAPDAAFLALRDSVA